MSVSAQLRGHLRDARHAVRAILQAFTEAGLPIRLVRTVAEHLLRGLVRVHDHAVIVAQRHGLAHAVQELGVDTQVVLAAKGLDTALENHDHVRFLRRMIEPIESAGGVETATVAGEERNRRSCVGFRLERLRQSSARARVIEAGVRASEERLEGAILEDEPTVGTEHAVRLRMRLEQPFEQTRCF